MQNRQTERLRQQFETLRDQTPVELLRDWRNHPGTEMLLLYLHATHETIKEHWANGAFTRESMEATCQKNAEEIGRAGAIVDLIELIRDTGEDS